MRRRGRRPSQTDSADAPGRGPPRRSRIGARCRSRQASTGRHREQRWRQRDSRASWTGCCHRRAGDVEHRTRLSVPGAPSCSGDRSSAATPRPKPNRFGPSLLNASVSASPCSIRLSSRNWTRHSACTSHSDLSEPATLLDGRGMGCGPPLEQLRLRAVVDVRLTALLDRQDAGDALTDAERQQAEGLADLADPKVMSAAWT